MTIHIAYNAVFTRRQIPSYTSAANNPKLVCCFRDENKIPTFKATQMIQSGYNRGIEMGRAESRMHFIATSHM